MPPLDSIDSVEGGDTIVAPSTPPGRSATGIVRLSGPRASAIAATLMPDRTLRARSATVGDLVDAQGSLVDRVVATLFPGPSSYTGEDVVEISCHGSPPVLQFIVERALELGARLAGPGEFTRRAYHSGRLDLVQAEAVRDLIDASTLYQARVAARQNAGALSARLRTTKAHLLELIARLEAGIDFAEDDISVADRAEVVSRITAVADPVAALAEGFAVGKVVRSGMKLAIVGRPNVGKSSLFNRLLQRDRAIVNEAAGTTRDSISDTASFGGIPVELVDTAGLRAALDPIESEGVTRAWQSLHDVDCAIVVVDLSERRPDRDEEIWRRVSGVCPSLLVGNKNDLPTRYESDESLLPVSARTGDGIDHLRARIRDRVVPGLDERQEGTLITNIRQERLLRSAGASLSKALEAAHCQIPHEMLLLDLYEALQALDGITGATKIDDVLDRIFSTFCIGK